MTARRLVLLGCGGAWGVLLLWSLAHRVAGLAPRLADLGAAPARRAEIESGDPEFHRLVAALGVLALDGEALVLVTDPPPPAVFYYRSRSAYELYPIRVRYLPTSARPPARGGITLRGDGTLAALVRERPVAFTAWFVPAEPALSRVFAVAPEPGGGVAFAAVEAGPPPPPAGSPSLPLAAAGVLVIAALGWAVSAALRLDPALGSSLPARLALGWIVGSGAMAWEMTVLSLAGVRWNLPILLLPWIVPLALAVRRLMRLPPFTPSPLPGEVVLGSPPGDRVGVRGPAVWQLAGLGLVLPAAALALLQALLPMNAWHHWDGWCTWGFKALAAARAGGLPLAFLADPAYDYSNPPYPLALPLTGVALSLFAGGLNDSVLRLGCAASYLALLALVARLLADLGLGPVRWILTGLFALVPKILDFGVNGYAEVPVAAAGLAAVVLLPAVRRPSTGSGPGGAVSPLAFGLLAGCAGNLKHEGLVVAAGIAGVLAWDAFRDKGPRGALPRALLALALVLVPWRLVGAARHGIGVAQFLPGRALDEAPERLLTAAWGGALEALGPGATLPGIERGAPEWSLWPEAVRDRWLLFWWVVSAALVAGGRALRAPPARAPAFILGVQAAAFAAVYAWSPLNLPWLVVASVDRVLIQLAPLSFCLACACARRAIALSP